MPPPQIAMTGDETGLFIPPGWLHAVFTIQSSYLGGFVFVHDAGQATAEVLLNEMQKKTEFGQEADVDEAIEVVVIVLDMFEAHFKRSVKEPNTLITRGRIRGIWVRLVEALEKHPALGLAVRKKMVRIEKLFARDLDKPEPLQPRKRCRQA